MQLFDSEDFKYPPPNEFSLGKEQAKERKSGFAPSMSFLKESIRPKTDANLANPFRLCNAKQHPGFQFPIDLFQNYSILNNRHTSVTAG